MGRSWYWLHGYERQWSTLRRCWTNRFCWLCRCTKTWPRNPRCFSSISGWGLSFSKGNSRWWRNCIITWNCYWIRYVWNCPRMATKGWSDYWRTFARRRCIDWVAFFWNPFKRILTGKKSIGAWWSVLYRWCTVWYRCVRARSITLCRSAECTY